MTKIRIVSITSEQAQRYRNGGLDAHGMEPQVHLSDGSGLPCRHCQNDIEKDARYLILAYKPFEKDQPYAEVGPIFLHAEPCNRRHEHAPIPEMFLERQSYLLKGYDQDHKIVYGTGKIVTPQDIELYAAEIFNDPNVAYAHLRSSLNNCYTCRIDRA